MQTESEVIRTWSGSHWEINLEHAFLSIKDSGSVERIPCDGTIWVDTKRRWFRWHLLIGKKTRLKLIGISRIEARLLAATFELSRSRLWSEKLQRTLQEHRDAQRWIPQEVADEILVTKPPFSRRESIERFCMRNRFNEAELQTLIDIDLDLTKTFVEFNDIILSAELTNQREFFDCIETKPLSVEQATAVITFDNRVLLVAAAGSGKTSVMVARAAYATKKKFVDPSKILLLAFNNAAAQELQGRVKARFSEANIPSDGIKASTFHAFGLDVIGRGLGARPKLAPWVDSESSLEEIAAIVKELKESSQDFKYKWDLYRLIFPPETIRAAGSVEPDSWDSNLRKHGFRTFDNRIVRSHGERMIANWLYLHGIIYEYERSYTIRTADATHRQYLPDFYYPEIDVWHEHWALDLHGNPPPEFLGYLDGVQWKRELHTTNNTHLVETTFGEVIFANGLTVLKEELARRGAKFDWNPDRPKAAYTNIEDSEVVKLVMTFMTHVKSNSLTESDIRSRLDGEWSHLKSGRTDLFLDIFWKVFSAWNQRLLAAEAIDFEDMLIQAADLVEKGIHTPNYDLILVDEFQDSSAARARLIKSLLRLKGKYVLAVGDDWQSINRFAGADVSIMGKFHDYFGEGPTLLLSRTFRYSQLIADISTEFITKNPEQLEKQVVAGRDGKDNPVVLIRAEGEQQGVREALSRISQDVDARGVSSVSVFVLGRYGFNRDWLPLEHFQNLRVIYRTIHASKGLEADYVVLVNLERGTHGFPSEIEDDPILNLAMSEPEVFEHAEERRLLYVALTRAKRQVFLVTRQGRESIFAVEFMTDSLIEVDTLDGDPSGITSVQTCPKCTKGVMVIRAGPYSNFLGCSRFPKCVYKSNIGLG